MLAGVLAFSCSTTRKFPMTLPSNSDFISPYTWSDTLRASRILVVGDLQPTSWFEMTFMGRTQNDSIREGIVQRMADEDPDMLLMLGDYVASGEREEDWLAFDSLMGPVCTQKIPVMAVLGNHDYGMVGSDGVAHCNARFPHVAALPSLTMLADSTALLVVDSNIESLPEERQRTQQRRYREILRRLDRSPAIKGVVVASHHPPITNAALAIDPRVHDTFVPPFLEAKKTMLFLSGHIHSYERFEIEGKTFVVSGGGGGPRREVDTSATRPHTTDQYRSGAWRYHHYLDLQVRSEGIRGETWMLVGEEYRLGDGFALRFGK